MYKNITAALAMTLAATIVAPSAIAKDARKGGDAALMPASSLKWSDVAGFPGVQMTVLQGNPEKGAHHAMLKLPGGFAAPLHHHTSDHFVTVVSGTLVLTVDGKETKLPAGSYFSFIGKKQHITKCESGADCVLSVDSRGKWDVLPDDGKPAAKKK
jgi:quercetin dioxygenase-like cupin family protein